MKNGDTSIHNTGLRKEDGKLHQGLTKREYFAAKAMQGYISGVLAWTDGLNGGGAFASDTEVAQEAVAYADALLKELENV